MCIRLYNHVIYPRLRRRRRLLYTCLYIATVGKTDLLFPAYTVYTLLRSLHTSSRKTLRLLFFPSTFCERKNRLDPVGRGGCE
jgi:hypothetical protein